MPDYMVGFVTEGFHSHAHDCVVGLQKVAVSAGAFYIIVRSRGWEWGRKGGTLGGWGLALAVFFIN